MLQCVVINWDGTLVSSSHMIHEAYLRTMRALQFQKKWSFEDTLRQSGRPPVEIFSDPSILEKNRSEQSQKNSSTKGWKISARKIPNCYNSKKEPLN